MGTVLTEASAIQCGHKGKLTTSGVPRLTVGGKAVLTEASLRHATISPDCTNPNRKCTHVLSLLPGSTAGRLKVNGEAVVIDSLSGTTDGIPIGSPTVDDAHDDKLRAE